MKKNWYAVYTKSHGEIKTAASLTKKKIENYCPLNRVVITQDTKNKIVYEPLFSSIVFVHILDTEIQIVNQIGSIVNFAFWLGKPVIIMDSEIENIRHFTNQYYNIKMEKAIVKGNNVKILSDQSNEINNTIVSVRDSNAKILLPSLGFTLTAEIEKPAKEAFNYSFDRNQMVS